MTLHRLLVGAPTDLPSGFERERMMVGSVSPMPTPAPMLRTWLVRFSSLAAAAVALLVMLPRAQDQPSPDAAAVPDTEYMGRKGAPSIPEEPGIGVSGVTESELEYEVQARGTRAYLDDYLRVYTRNQTDRYRWVFVFGLQEGRAPIWYGPDPREGQRTSLALERSATRILGAGVDPVEFKLSGRHQAGPLRVVGLFTREPLALDRVREALAGLSGAEDVAERLRVGLGLSEDAIIRILRIHVAAGTRLEAAHAP